MPAKWLIYIISAIQNEEAKVKRSIKDAAKKGDKDVCRILAKEMINSRKAVNKMYASKAQLNSVEMGMKNQLGNYPSILTQMFVDLVCAHTFLYKNPYFSLCFSLHAHIFGQQKQ